MNATELHATARRAFRHVAATTAALLITLTFTTILAFTDAGGSVWLERARVVAHTLTMFAVGGALVVTAQLRIATKTPVSPDPGETQRGSS